MPEAEDIETNTLEENVVPKGGVLSVPGSMATMTKLLHEGHNDCIRLYVCEQLSNRNIFSYSMDDLLVWVINCQWFAKFKIVAKASFLFLRKDNLNVIMYVRTVLKYDVWNYLRVKLK